MLETNDIKRYELTVYHDGGPARPDIDERESPTGEWAKWDDVARLAAENAGLRAEVVALKAEQRSVIAAMGDWCVGDRPGTTLADAVAAMTAVADGKDVRFAALWREAEAERDRLRAALERIASDEVVYYSEVDVADVHWRQRAAVEALAGIAPPKEQP